MQEPWWRKWWRSFLGKTEEQQPALAPTGEVDVPMDVEKLRGLVDSVFATRSDELGCDDCFELVDQFAEMVLAGKDASEMMPLVQDHLDRCPPCRVEFEALLDALKSLA